MKLLITDNETEIRNGIRKMLAYCPEITAVQEATGVQDGLQKIKSFQPDIVLLDVEMDDGTGFDLLKLLDTVPFQLIFATAHNKYAIDAFQFSAIDYLLKPVDPDALQKSVEKAARNIRNNNMGKQIEVLLQQLTDKTHTEKRLVLKDLENIYFFKTSELLYAVAEGTYTKFFTETSSPVMVSKNLKEYETILEPAGFIRTHHGYLVNPDKIIRYDKTDGGGLVLTNGNIIPLAKRKKDQVIQLLERRAMNK